MKFLAIFGCGKPLCSIPMSCIICSVENLGVIKVILIKHLKKFQCFLQVHVQVFIKIHNLLEVGVFMFYFICFLINTVF